MSLLLLAISPNTFTADQIAALEAAVPSGMSLLITEDKHEFEDRFDEIELAAGWVRPAWIQQMPNVKWVQTWAAGADWITRYPDLMQAPFTLTNASGVHAVQISEHVLGMLLYFGRNFNNARKAQRDKVWPRLKHPSEPLDAVQRDMSWHDVFELAGKTMMILGLGAIGERTAKLAQAFDMHVIGVRRDPTKGSPHVNHMVGMSEWVALLPSVDYVVNILPETAETRHILNAVSFAAMKRTGIVINVGRGASIDEAALIDALQLGEIAAAGLDVFETEPLSAESPLWEMENVLMTSHYSGGSARYHERMLTIFFDNLQRYAEGSPLRNVVNKQLGY